MGDMTQGLFYIFGALALTAALLAITRRNPVASAIWLVVMFFCLAGIYVVLEAFFVAAVQVLVYAGAIMVLFLFVIMLLDLRSEAIEKGAGIHYRFFSVMMALLFVTAAGITLWQAHGEGTFEPVTGADGSVVALDGSADAIGGALFRHWLLAFEVTSILLLGAILGAVILTKRRLT